MTGMPVDSPADGERCCCCDNDDDEPDTDDTGVTTPTDADDDDDGTGEPGAAGVARTPLLPVLAASAGGPIDSDSRPRGAACAVAGVRGAPSTGDGGTGES